MLVLFYVSAVSHFFCYASRALRDSLSFPTRRSSDRTVGVPHLVVVVEDVELVDVVSRGRLLRLTTSTSSTRSEEHTSELQSHSDLVCRLLLEKKKKNQKEKRNKQKNENVHKQNHNEI